MRDWLKWHLLLLWILTLLLSAAIPGWAQEADTDGDGVLDDYDYCPNEHGGGSLDGCIDRDGDGVLGGADACPNSAHPENSDGCTNDFDNDGFLNSNDACPYNFAPASPDGCPLGIDSDGDDVDDERDPCPSDPDCDDDGTPDWELCPLVPGLPDNGCPEVTCIVGPGEHNRFDGDCDGLADQDDRCPAVAGDPANGGCPLEAGTGAIDPLPVTDTGASIPITDPNAPSPISDFVAVPPPNDNLCRVAPSGSERVNVRFEPTTDALRVAQLLPGNWYQVYELQSAVGEGWYRIDTGWVAEWVMQSSGDCSTIVQSVAEAKADNSGTSTETTTINNYPLTLSVRDALDAIAQLGLGWLTFQVQQWL